MTSHITKSEWLLIIQTAVLKSNIKAIEFNKSLKTFPSSQALLDAITYYDVAAFEAGKASVSDLNDFLQWTVLGTEFAKIKEVLGPRKERPY
jgi:hypothetical protein